jgi:hypothetical protein
MSSIMHHFRRSVALLLLVAALVNLCLTLKLVIATDASYVAGRQLIVPLMVLSFALWAAGCFVNRAIYRVDLPASAVRAAD